MPPVDGKAVSLMTYPNWLPEADVNRSHPGVLAVPVSVAEPPMYHGGEGTVVPWKLWLTGNGLTASAGAARRGVTQTASANASRM